MKTALLHTPMTQGAWLQRAEGMVFLVGAIALYQWDHGNWGMFALLLFVPDLSALGYLFQHRWAFGMYNLAHTLVGPVLLAASGVLTGHQVLFLLALIWCAHIGMDRMVGYGFRESSQEEGI